MKRFITIAISALLAVGIVMTSHASTQIRAGNEPENELLSQSIVEEASPSQTKSKKTLLGQGSETVRWHIIYTDSETHSKRFACDEEGSGPNGISVYIGFPESLIDENGDIWETDMVPGNRRMWGPGTVTVYIGYDKTGSIPQPEDPYEEAKENLSEWIAKAKECDAEITGQSAGSIPDERVICETPGKSKLRLLSAASAITDTKKHTVIIIGKDNYPTGIVLKENYGDRIVYSHDLLEDIDLEDGRYTVHRFLIWKSHAKESCAHEYETRTDIPAGCLTRGVTKKVCKRCGKTETVYHSATGHSDANNDSVCDNCGYRVSTNDLGESILTTLTIGTESIPITWTLVDSDYHGGCLYIADNGISANKLGGYGSGKEYYQTEVFKFLSGQFSSKHSVNGENLKFLSEDNTTAYAQMLSYETALTYRDLMGSGDYVTHSGDGTSLIVLHEDGSLGLVSADEDVSIRPAILLTKPYQYEATPAHWRVGDRLTRMIDGNSYTFTCIDENCSDIYGNHTLSALFLCDTVIPAGYGSTYAWEIDADGHYASVWHPGPICYFGESNNYKYSKIRQFLDAQTVFSAADIVTGVTSSYTGTTKAGKFSQTTDTGLIRYDIGYQKMNARLFILSVEEALKYKDRLWKFNGSETDNPEDVTQSTCTGYWLRDPAGNLTTHSTSNTAYIVDLKNGNIHAEGIKPEGGTGDAFIDTQTSIGTRPAFTLPNK